MANPTQQNVFVVPPPAIYGYDFQHNTVYPTGSSVEFQWKTNYTSMILGLSQFGSAGSADVLLSYYTSNTYLPNVYMLTIWEGTKFTGATFSSRYFNISFDRPTPSTLSHSPTARASSNNSTVRVGLGVGMGLGLPVFLLLGFILGWFMRKRRTSPSQTESYLRNQTALREKLPVTVRQNPAFAARGTDVGITAELGEEGMAELAARPRSGE
ncbi:hypothetical protein BJ875DRAFT_547325 [Amylocarpus encephaloides]|uniref:Mid2 domain-containing protein n=1 Tax=Amylocarpus encephaloides TaxID=45428 RepID=A0A9P8C0M2_9HELO|nr:hypothetical protein BJ875DRAFT_547325 [Amylocarpus encephaloides]